MKVVLCFSDLTGPKDRFTVSAVIGKSKSGSVKGCYLYAVKPESTPYTVFFGGTPEGMLFGKIQTKKCFSEPLGRFRAGITLDQRCKLAVEAEGRNTVKEYVFAG